MRPNKALQSAALLRYDFMSILASVPKSAATCACRSGG